MDEQQVTPSQMRFDELKGYILRHTDEWRSFRQSEYEKDFRDYEHMARGRFDEQSNPTAGRVRSKVVAPLTQQAIRSVTDEVDEAVIQSGDFADLQAELDSNPQSTKIFGMMRNEFKRRLYTDGWRPNLSKAVSVAATYGSAFGELVVEKTKEYNVITPDGQTIGALEVPRHAIKLRIWSPRHILVDWSVDTIEDSQGIAIEDSMPAHLVAEKIRNKDYFPVSLATTSQDESQNADPKQAQRYQGVPVLRWYGLVPERLLADDVGYAQMTVDDTPEVLVEAVVHLVNNQVAMAAKNPTMRQRRGVEHYPFERVPGRLLGRGIAEAGLSMQAAADASLRAHLDSLAITSAAVTATDTTRFPKGFNFSIYNGRNMPVSGPVDDAIKRLDLGTTDPALLGTSQTFERLFMQATGTMDSGVLPDLVKGGTDPTALMIALNALIRRNRQRVMNFQWYFALPLIEEAFYRLVQLEPQAFPPFKVTVQAVGTVGMLEREFESSKIVRLLQTLGPESPVVPLMMREIVSLSNTKGRENIMMGLAEATKALMEKAKSDGGAKQREQLAMTQLALDAELKKATITKVFEEANYERMRTSLLPREVEAKVVAALSNNLKAGTTDDSEFERRARIAELALKERSLDQNDADRVSNERITLQQNGGVDHTQSYAEISEKLAKLEQRSGRPKRFILDADDNVVGFQDDDTTQEPSTTQE